MKTETMIFSLRHHSSDTNSLHYVKFLGVTPDIKLTWENHTALICKNASRNIFLLRNLMKCVSQATVLIAYHTLIQSILTYARLVWGHSAHTAAVFSMQRKEG